MRKQQEVIENIKSIIRDELAWKPVMSVRQMQVALARYGYVGATSGFLDWHFVSKLLKKVRLENIERLNRESRQERLVHLKERYRVISEDLIEIVKGRTLLDNGTESRYPTLTERMVAANTLLKWDTAIFFAEEAVKARIQPNNGTIEERPEPVAVVIREEAENKTRKWARFMPKILNE